MNINLTPIFEAVLALLAALITYKLIPWIRSKTTESQQKTLRAIYEGAVMVAEQLYGAGKGDEKFRYATQKLAAKGIDVDPDAIEEAVFRLFHYNQPEETKDAEKGEDQNADEAEIGQ